MKTCNTTYRKKISMKKGRVFTIAKYSMRERELEHSYIYIDTLWYTECSFFADSTVILKLILEDWIFESLWSTGGADSQVPSSCSIWGLPQVLLGNFTTLAAMRAVVTAEAAALSKITPGSLQSIPFESSFSSWASQPRPKSETPPMADGQR